MIAPALGVPPRFYRAFAQFLQGEGLAVRIADPSTHTLADWAARDLPDALADLASRFPGVPRVWIGHSMGGQLFGLVRDADVVRALLVAAQHGHWRNWPAPSRYAMAALWWGAIPVVARALGRVPMPGGVVVPGTIARRWARWGRSRRYLLDDADARSGFATYRGPIVSYAIEDDRYAPVTTVRPLAAAFRATAAEVRVAHPRAFGVDTLGHFGCFRAPAIALWREWLAWLTAAG